MAQSFVIKQAIPEMVAGIRALDVAAWGEESAATEEMIESRIRIYPFGNFVAVERSTDKIIGSVFTVSSADTPVTTWWEATGAGTYEGMYEPFGPVVYGVNLAVVPDKRGAQVGLAILSWALNTVWIFGKHLGRLGARMPEYCKWQVLFSPEDYIRLYLAGDQIVFAGEDGTYRSRPLDDVEARRQVFGSQRLDPRQWDRYPHVPLRELCPLDGELAFFCSCKVRERTFEIIRLLPGYFPPDPESQGHGVLLEWHNPDLD